MMHALHPASGAIDNPLGLDIYIYVAHQRADAKSLRKLLDVMFDELEWDLLSATILMIVDDDCDLSKLNDPRVTFVRESDAAIKFVIRCRESEAAPHDVLVCFGAALPSIDAIGRLQSTLRDDEMAGAAAPRIAFDPFGHFMALGDQPDSADVGLVDRTRCNGLASIYYMPEDLLPCLCIAARVIGNIEPPADFTYFPDTVLTLLRAGRRRGLLLLVDNKSVLTTSNYKFNKRAILKESDKMQRLFTDYAAVQKQLVDHSAIAQESLMSVSAENGVDSAPSLLLDCTNMPPIFNGTTECALGLLGGINKSGTDGWKVCAMVPDEARRYFSLDDEFPAIRFIPISSTERFDVAIRLSQVWSIVTMLDLSKRARSIAVMILDTIGPEIIYSAPQGSDEAFQFVGDHADGIAYISKFSQHQFRRRYFVRPDSVESVVYLSLDPRDYVSQGQHAADQGKSILLFGNAYDHKDMGRTVATLATAFPFEKFNVIGLEYTHTSNVEGFLSGSLDGKMIEQLYHEAKCVVFPSFYEGFGFPVVRGLAYGKTVIARNSKLLHEIASNISNVGRLIEFENTLDLVGIVAHLLRGDDYPSLPLGGNVSAKSGPHSWAKAGEQILAFAKQLRASENPQRWLQRDRALRYVFESIKQ
jgi:glycosyltransferase involved in cell wall biosynthesis